MKDIIMNCISNLLNIKAAKDMKREIAQWLKEINNTTLPNDIVALNFGIFETEEGYGLYMIGATEYCEDDEDWACEPVAYKSDYLILNDPELKTMNWEGVLEKIVKILHEALFGYVSDGQSLFYGKIITTGFDDGELVRL